MITPGDKTGKKEWIYLSPHLDDAVLSCGGLIAMQIDQGDLVSIWTMFAGDPPIGGYSAFARELHTRWDLAGSPPAARRLEDQAACKILGAKIFQFPFSDCIYRRSPNDDTFLYPSEASIFNEPHPLETGLADKLVEALAVRLPSDVNLVCPLAIGNHVDYQITQEAAELTGFPLLFYADYPYIVEEGLAPGTTGGIKLEAGLRAIKFSLSEVELRIWGDAVAAYTSQLSTFWSGKPAMRKALVHYYRQRQNMTLWKRIVS